VELMADRSSDPALTSPLHTFSLVSRLRSFAYAARGIRALVSSQHNAWVHAFATLLTVGFGLCLEIPRLEWFPLVFAITFVWTAEAINTAVELLCDLVSPDFHPIVATAKDVAAGAVLISALGATVTAVLVFGPRLGMFFR
jgi:diacylglycerol kinase (ATP)